MKTKTCFKNPEGKWHRFDTKKGSVCGKAKPIYEPGGGTRWAMRESDPKPMCKGCTDDD